jgi:hypothetical protein
MLVRTSIGPFDVRSPPIKKHKIAGHLVPTFRTATRFVNVKRRRIMIEILSPAAAEASVAAATATTSPTQARPWDPENEVLNDHDNVVLRIFRLTRKKQGGVNAATDNTDHHDDHDDGRFLGRLTKDCSPY